METAKKNDKIFVRLDRGEEILDSLDEIREQYGITNGFFQGIGAVDRVKLGNYDVGEKEYHERDLEGNFEVPSFSGNIGPDKIHAHITVSDRTYSPKAGHCGQARVSGTFEIVILVTEGVPLNHQFDPATGLDVFDLS